jgi:4-amino-4-deoxy-L-arabinose transferase-like glycosyltransferase
MTDHARGREERRPAAGGAALAAWAIVLVTACAAVAASHYTSRDPDSTLYSVMSARLVSQPVAAWIAPEWNGLWDKQGLFREHPVGILVLPAILARLGYPPLQAAFAVGAAMSILSLLLLRISVAPLVRWHEAIAVQWAALVLPVAFTYRVRANQEYPVLAMTLFGLFALERSRYRRGWIAGLMAAMCGLAFVKGVFVVFLPIVSVLWLLSIERADRGSDRWAWIGIGLAVLSVVAGAWLYEVMYVRAAGESFLSFYLTDRIGENAGLTDGRGWSIGTKLYNIVWYTGRVVWFALPGSLVLLISASRARLASTPARRRLVFALTTTAAYIGAMSVGANRAERFIFPAFFIIGSAGAVVAMRRWPRVDRAALRLASAAPYALPLAWLGLFMLTLATSQGLPYVEIWSS